MKKNIITILFLALSIMLSAQQIDSSLIHGLRELGARGATGTTYQETNHTGIKNEILADLENAATELKSVIPTTVAPDFKVFDYGSYPVLKFMSNATFSDDLLASMEVEVKKITQNYLLIGRYTDPSTGKVTFKVKLSLPITANKGVNSNPMFNGSKISSWEKALREYLNNDANPPEYNKYLVTEKDGILRITKMISAELTLQGARYYYRPDGYPIYVGNIIDNITNIADEKDYSDVVSKDGFVFGWVLEKKDANNQLIKERYYAVIKNNLFYGYYLNGLRNESNPNEGLFIEEKTSSTVGEIIQVRSVKYLKEDCAAIEWTSTDYKLSTIPTVASPLKNSIYDNSNLPSGFGFLKESTTKVKVIACNDKLIDKYYSYFVFKLSTQNNTFETKLALKDFCTELASKREGIEYTEVFMSKSQDYLGEYTYFKNGTIQKAEGNEDFPKRVNFLERAFLPSDPNDWNTKVFATVTKEIIRYHNLYCDVSLRKKNTFIDYNEFFSKVVTNKIGLLGGDNVYLFQIVNQLPSDKIVDLLKKVYASPIGTPEIRERLLYIIQECDAQLLSSLISMIENDANLISSLQDLNGPTLFQIARYLTLNKISSKALNLDDGQIDKSIFYIPINVSSLLHGTEVNYYGVNNTFSADFFELDWYEVEYNPIPQYWSQWSKKGASVISKDIAPKGFSPLSFIIVKAGSEKYKQDENGNKTSIYKDFLMDEENGIYVVSPLLLYADHKIANEKLRKEILSTTFTVASFALVGVEVIAVRSAFIAKNMVGVVAKTVWLASDVTVLGLNLAGTDVISSEDREFVNKAYLTLSLLRFGTNFAVNQFLKSDNGKKFVVDFLGDCETRAAAAGTGNYAKKIAARIFKDYGYLKACFLAGTPIYLSNYTDLVPIEKINIGDKVASNAKVTKGSAAKLAENGKVSYLRLDAEINPDPYTSADQKALDKLDYSSVETQIVTLSMSKANGSVSEIKLLRPTVWLERNGIAEKGKSTYLHLPEMGLDGYATVTDLAHFRVTKSDTASEENSFPFGEGRDGATWTSGLVTGVFKHIANSVYHLRYDNGDSLGVTGTHPLYSLDRQGFVPVENLNIGEHLLTKAGTVTIVSKEYDATPQEVYNLEVGQWHNFLVGESGVVVHNGCITQGELDGLIPEVPNANNYITKKQFEKALKTHAAGDKFLEQKINEIITNGDIGGNLTEDIANRIFNKHLGYELLDAKVGADNGIDGFYILRNANGQIEQIVAVECKQLSTSTNAGGYIVSNGAQLSKGDPLNTGLPKQFSDDWFRNVRDRLRNAGKTEVADLISQNIGNPNVFKRYIIAVDKATISNPAPINILKIEPFN